MSRTEPHPDKTTSTLSIVQPRATDAAAVHALIARCPPLDRNSLYCNLLQCSDFAESCALARLDGRVAGFVSGYLPPRKPNVLFIWQVAVDSAARGHGLARRLIQDILDRDACADVEWIHTTVTPGNEASRAMFTRLAEELGAGVEVRPHFDRHVHLAGQADSEELFLIGPFVARGSTGG
ncbi:MAG: diaminobutyrate acetyltransferase [Gammaproteobacteria bacterium]|nr:diaminobutyrate acetyltransferase [Gammaproteobacteria bacterium]MCP5198507.1 diaminobutyrate acetyltransferase [Gammaproteobacteria bacterium]